MAVHSEKKPLELLQELSESFNRMSVALELIGEGIGTLQKSSVDYELEFSNEGTFQGKRSLLNPEKLFPKEHGFCIYITSACEELPKSVERLRGAYCIADEAVRSLPPEVFALLDRHVARPWQPMVRQECLDLILVWPGEVLNTLGSRSVSSRVQILLTNAEHCSPFETWGNYIQRLDVYRSHIVAIRDCVAEPPAGGGAEAGAKRRGRKKADTDTKTLIIAALNEYHQYSKGRCEDVGHVGVNKLADQLKLSSGTVSGFFKKEFGGHNKYKIACGNLRNLAYSLKILNGDLPPSILFNALGDNVDNLADE